MQADDESKRDLEIKIEEMFDKADELMINAKDFAAAVRFCSSFLESYLLRNSTARPAKH